MRIMMLLNAAYPPDIRVEKETHTLVSNGIKVDIVCNRRKKEAPLEENGNITIHRINSPANDQKMKHGIYDAIAAINFIHPVFYFALKKLIPEIKPDAIHVHDLPLAKTGIKLGKKFGIPVVLDLHENYPDALEVWFKWKPKGIARIKDLLLFTYDRWSKQEKWACQKADHIIAVVDEMKTDLIQRHGLQDEKITVIPNTEKKSFADVNQGVLSRLKEQYKNNYVISYIGGMGPHRGLDTVIKGMPLVIEKIPEVKLLLVGGASSGVLPKLTELVRNLGIENHVQFVGRVPFSEVQSYMKLSDINLVPHNSNGHTEKSLPHKLFQILLLECNLLVSSCKPLKRIVFQYNAGYIFEADNSTSFADNVTHMYENPEEVKEFAKNGFEATMNGKLNWDHTGEKLVELYQKILNH